MSEAPKSFHLSPQVHDYLVAHGTAPDALLRELAEETRALGPLSWTQTPLPNLGGTPNHDVAGAWHDVGEAERAGFDQSDAVKASW